MVAPMFAWLNLPQIRKELTALANTVVQYKEAVEILKLKIIAVGEEVHQGVADQVAAAIAPLQKEIDSLQEKVEELATRPEGVIDLDQILADFATLKQHVGKIYVAPTPEVGFSSEIELPIDEDDDEDDSDDEPPVVEPEPTEPETEPEAEVIPVDGEFDDKSQWATTPGADLIITEFDDFDDVPTVILAPIDPDPEA